MRRRTLILQYNCKPQNRSYALLSASATSPLPIEFLSTSFGYFSRSLPPTIPEILKLLPTRSFRRRVISSFGLGSIRVLDKRSDCICGRIKYNCLRCRPSSTLAGPTIPLLSDAIDLPTKEQEETIPILLSNPEFTTDPPPNPLSTLRNHYNTLHATLPSVRTHLDTKRQLPKSRKPHSSQFTPSAPWTLPRLESEADSLWTALYLTPTSSTMKKFTLAQELDVIRIFSRLVRAYPYASDVTAITNDRDIGRIEGESFRFEKYRRLQGERINYLLSRIENRKEVDHMRSRAALYLDSLALQDILPSLPTSPPDSPTSPFDTALVSIFLTPPTDPSKEKSILQSRLSTLSILIDSWKRSQTGPAEAVKLLVDWGVEEVLSLKVEQIPTFQTVLVRSYGDLLSRLSPTPMQWYQENTNIRNCRRIGLHLISHLSLSGHATQALKIWESLKISDVGLSESEVVETGTALMEGLVRGGYFEDANLLLKELDFTSLASSARTDTALQIKALKVAAKVVASRGKLSKVEKYFNQIQTITDVGIGLERIARLMRAHTDAGSLIAVTKLFESEETRNLMKLASKEDQARLYGELIRANVKVDEVLGGMKALESMIQLGLNPTLQIINTLLFGFANRSDRDRTYALFNRLTTFHYTPDITSYNALLTLHANLRDPEAGQKVIKDLELDSLRPDLRSWTTLMNAFVEVGSWNKAIDIFQFLDSHEDPSLRPDIATTNVLLKANVLLATPAQTILSLFRRTLSRGLKPNAQTYTLVMHSLCTAGMMDVAEDLFTLMDQTVIANDSDLPLPPNIIAPDAFIFSILIRGYLAKDDTIKARACLNEMKAREISPSSITYGIIVGSFLKGNTVGGLKSARALAKDFLESSPLEKTRATRLTKFDKPLARGQELLNVFGPIINSYAKKMEAGLAMEYFQQLLKEDVTPTIPLYTSLMDAYRGIQQLDSVKYLWNHIHQLVLDTYPAAPSNTKPTFPPTEDPVLVKIDSDHQNILCLPFSIYIDSLAAANSHLEIAKTWQELTAEGFAFDSSNWNSLAIALVEDGQLERAFWISEFILSPADRDEEGNDITVPGAEGGNLGKSFSTDVMTRLPSRLYQQREGERANQRRRPLDVATALSSPPDTLEEGSNLINSIYQSQEILRSHTWFPHSNLLSALSQALYNLTITGGRKIAKGAWQRHETILAEQFEILLSESEAESLLNKLSDEHGKTLDAIAIWERARRRRREQEEILE